MHPRLTACALGWLFLRSKQESKIGWTCLSFISKVSTWNHGQHTVTSFNALDVSLNKDTGDLLGRFVDEINALGGLSNNLFRVSSCSKSRKMSSHLRNEGLVHPEFYQLHMHHEPQDGLQHGARGG